MIDAAWLTCLACPSCRAHLEPAAASSLACRRCSRTFPQQDGVYDFLAEAHPIVQRERAAIATLDSSDPAFLVTLDRWLKTLDSGGNDFGGEEERCAFVSNAVSHRNRIRELLDRYPPARGGLVVELGADHCWASGIFIDKGLRVAAVDISDHLAMAPRKTSAMLLRLKADMNRLPIESGSAQYVFANAAAHHSWNLAMTFAEAHRVLAPGGRFYLCSEPMPGLLRYLAFTVLNTFGRAERAAGINETLSRRSAWTRAAQGAGFTTTLVFPDYSDADLRAKLKARHLPALLRGPVRRFHRSAQASIHMIADKRSA